MACGDYWGCGPGACKVDRVAREPDGAAGQANPGRPAPPAGAPERSPPSARSLSAYRVRALQVTQRHSHSDATTLAATTADSSRSLSRYDSNTTPIPARAPG